MPTHYPEGSDARVLALRLETAPFTVFHLFVALTCAVGFALDLLEVSYGGVLSVVYSAPPHPLSAATLTAMLSAVFFGAILGAPLVGILASRCGPKRVLFGAAVWMAATSFGAAASPNPSTLTVVRFLSGLALGGFPPLMFAYLTDVLPRAHRGLVVFAVCALGYIAPALAAFLVRADTLAPVLTIEPWRLPLLIAAGLGVFIAAASYALPEGPRWLLARGQTDRARGVFMRLQQAPQLTAEGALPAASRKVGRTLSPDLAQRGAKNFKQRLAFLGILYFLIPWATTAFPLVTGPVLMARGLGVSASLVYVAAAAFGPALGTVVGGALIDLIDHRWSLVGSALGMMVTALWFFTSPGPVELAVVVVLFGVFSALYLPTIGLYGAKLFPPTSRASATSLAWMLNRIGAALAPVLLVPLARGDGALAIATIICGALAAGIIVVITAAPEQPRFIS